MSERLGLFRETLAEVRIEPPFAAAYRTGFDESTVACLTRELARPALATVRLRVGAGPSDGGRFLDSLARLADPATAAEEISVANLIARAAELEAGNERIARAVLGLMGVAVLEGLAFKHRSTDFLWITLETIATVIFPAARWLADCCATWSARRMSQLQREFLLSDPYHRGTDKGRALVKQFRGLEAIGEKQLLADCREVSYLLRECINDYRAGVATLFFAIGDAVRAFAIAGEDKHSPSLQVLRDLVEVSIRLTPVDPLLRAVWALVISTTNAPVPEHLVSRMSAADEYEGSIQSIIGSFIDSRYDMSLSVRQAYELQSMFKAADATCATEYGMTMSSAYACGLLAHFSVLVGKDSFPDTTWKDVLANAVRKDLEWVEYHPSIYARIFELLSLHQTPGTPLANSEYLLSLAQLKRPPFTDTRSLSSTAMMMELWNARQSQVGRSIAYDNAFYVESSRRKEKLSESLQRLEWHRYAGMISWLSAIPPACELPVEASERDILNEDMQISRKFREIAFYRRLPEMPVPCRVYGPKKFKKLLKLDPLLMTAMQSELHKRLAANKAQAEAAFPAYAERRYRQEASIGDLRAELMANGEASQPIQAVLLGPPGDIPAEMRAWWETTLRGQ